MRSVEARKPPKEARGPRGGGGQLACRGRSHVLAVASARRRSSHLDDRRSGRPMTATHLRWPRPVSPDAADPPASDTAAGTWTGCRQGLAWPHVPTLDQLTGNPGPSTLPVLPSKTQLDYPRPGQRPPDAGPGQGLELCSCQSSAAGLLRLDFRVHQTLRMTLAMETAIINTPSGNQRRTFPRTEVNFPVDVGCT